MSLNNTSNQISVDSSLTAQKKPRVLAPFDTLPDSSFAREAQLVQSPKRPDTPAPLPFSAPTLWRKVKDGTFPPPVKLSIRVTGWNVGVVRKWLKSLEKNEL